ncbi:MAG: phosphate ABC transporter substrate-binding protein [Candidatus Omnitrophica bacterium]|nr:phosphate ABC transporter substrate-binding protein [Candidatus Omnitrophota bacterium]
MRWVVIILALFLVTGCGKSKEAGKAATLAGSTAFQPFAEKLAQEYMKAHPDTRIIVQGGGSIVGIQSMKAGVADIAMADLVKLPDELTDEKGEYRFWTVAQDGIAIVVHPSNPVQDVSLENVRDIFSGKITSWENLGWENKEIVVVSREKGSGTGRSFEELVMGGLSLGPKMLFQDSNGTVRQTVAVTPEAIGYIFIGVVNETVKPVKLGGVVPAKENIVKGNYPLVNRIFYASKKGLNDSASDFVNFTLSPEGQGLLDKAGLIPVR